MSSASEELQERRRERVDRCRELKAELTRLKREIGALDEVLLMLDPSYRAEAARPNRRGPPTAMPFQRGEMPAAALEALRTIGRPASSAECARAMLAAKGIADDEPLQAQVAARVTALLSQKATVGQVRRAGNGDGRQVLWQIDR